MRRFSLSLSALAFCLLCACSTVQQPADTPLPSAQPTGTEPPAAVSAAPVQAPAPEWGEQVYMTAYAVEGRQSPVFAPEYRLPKITNADGVPAYEAINAAFAATLSDLSATAAELSGWAVDDYKAAQITGDTFYTYVDTESYVIAFESEEYVSFLRTHTSSAGTPLPTTFPVGSTFSLTTGEQLRFADLFTCPESDAAARVFSLLLEQNGQGAYMGAPLPEEELTESFQPEQFYLTESALVFYFPQSDVPSAIGSPTFAIPYEELSDILALSL